MHFGSRAKTRWDKWITHLYLTFIMSFIYSFKKICEWVKKLVKQGASIDIIKN